MKQETWSYYFLYAELPSALKTINTEQSPCRTHQAAYKGRSHAPQLTNRKKKSCTTQFLHYLMWMDKEIKSWNTEMKYSSYYYQRAEIRMTIRQTIRQPRPVLSTFMLYDVSESIISCFSKLFMIMYNDINIRKIHFRSSYNTYLAQNI